MKSIRLSFVYVISFLVISYSLFSLYRIILTTAPDFSVLYESAINLLHHRNMYTDPNLYTGFSYPPVTAFLYIPLTMVPYPVAQAIFSMISYCLLFGVMYYCFRLFGIKLRLVYYLGAISLTLLSFPVKFTLGMGQVNIIALFFLLFGLHTHHKVGPVVIALSIILKPQLLVLLFIFLLYKKCNVFIHICLWLIAIVLIETLCFGTVSWSQYIANKIPELVEATSNVGVYYNQGILGFAGRIAQGGSIIALYVAASFMVILSYGVSVAKRTSGKFLQSIALMFPLILLIEPFSWQHHYVFLIPSFFWIVTQIKTKPFFWILTVLIYAGISINIRNPVLMQANPANAMVLSHVGIATAALYGMMIWISWRKRYDV